MIEWYYFLIGSLFCCNVFLTGLAIGMDESRSTILLAFLAGSLIAIWVVLEWILLALDRLTEARTLFFLAFTHKFKDPHWQNVIDSYYHKVYWYKRWVLRCIARKYGYTIPPKE